MANDFIAGSINKDTIVPYLLKSFALNDHTMQELFIGMCAKLSHDLSQTHWNSLTSDQFHKVMSAREEKGLNSKVVAKYYESLEVNPIREVKDIVGFKNLTCCTRLSDLCTWSALFFLQCVDICDRNISCPCGKGSSLFYRCISVLENDWYGFEDLLEERKLTIPLEDMNKTRRSICRTMSNSISKLGSCLQDFGLDARVNCLFLMAYMMVIDIIRN